MPIYEYRCNDCGEVSEITVGIGAQEQPLQCLKCGGSNLEKLMSAHNVAVKSPPPSGPPSPDETGVFVGMSEDKSKTLVLPKKGGEPIAEWDSPI